MSAQPVNPRAKGAQPSRTAPRPTSTTDLGRYRTERMERFAGYLEDPECWRWLVAHCEAVALTHEEGSDTRSLLVCQALIASEIAARFAEQEDGA